MTNAIRPGLSPLLATFALVAAFSPAPATAQCEELDTPLVPFESETTAFAVQIEQPEGWHSLSQVPGRHIDFSTEASQFKSTFVFRFNTLGPLAADALTHTVDRDEATAIDLEDGTQILIAKPKIPGYPGLTVVVPTAGGSGEGHLVNAAVVSSPDECDEQALEVLRRIAEGLRPRPAG